MLKNTIFLHIPSPFFVCTSMISPIFLNVASAISIMCSETVNCCRIKHEHFHCFYTRILLDYIFGALQRLCCRESSFLCVTALFFLSTFLRSYERILRIFHEWSIHKKFMKRAIGEFPKFHIKWPVRRA